MASRKPHYFAYQSGHPYKSSPIVGTRAKNAPNEQQHSPQLANQVKCEKVGDKTPEAVTTLINMAATSSYFATAVQNEQSILSADHEVQNLLNEETDEKNAPFPESEAAIEQEMAPAQHNVLDANSLDSEFVGIIQQLEEKRCQDKLLMDQLSSFLRSSVEKIIATLERSFQDMHKTTNDHIQNLGDEFYEELQRSRRLEAKMTEIEHLLRSVFDNLQSFLPRPKIAPSN